MANADKPVTCSFCGHLNWVSEGVVVCPTCDRPTLRPATEWEAFIGHPLTWAQEERLRREVAWLLACHRGSSR